MTNCFVAAIKQVIFIEFSGISIYLESWKNFVIVKFNKNNCFIVILRTIIKCGIICVTEMLSCESYNSKILTNFPINVSTTAWKVSKYGVFSGMNFPIFRLNTEMSLKSENSLRKMGVECQLWNASFNNDLIDPPFPVPSHVGILE